MAIPHDDVYRRLESYENNPSVYSVGSVNSILMVVHHDG